MNEYDKNPCEHLLGGEKSNIQYNGVDDVL